VLEEIPSLTVAAAPAGGRAGEPWPGYDEQTVDEIAGVVANADAGRRAGVRRYERAHKARKTVIEATEREPANA
jgi:hypothetical protein